jgi:hypothetical protein
VQHAYLVLAHQQPRLLARLIDRIIDEQAHVFVHIDLRQDIRPFKQAIDRLQNERISTHLHYADNRRKVGYMAFSTVEATLDLMQQAAASGPFSYYTLLSGADYPIKSNEAIRNTLAASDTELIVYWKLDDRPSWRYKIEHYYLTEHVPIRPLLRPELTRPWRLGRSVPFFYWRLFFRFRNWFPKRTFPPGLIPYGGSQWWSLSRGCVRFILNYVEEHPEVVRFFRYVHCPDEMFFQTVILNSPWAGRTANYRRYHEWSEQTTSEQKTDESRIPEWSFNLRYIDWSGPIENGPRGYPAVLDSSDLALLKGSECLFARKFDEQRSSALLDQIDRDLLGRQASPSSGPLG